MTHGYLPRSSFLLQSCEIESLCDWHLDYIVSIKGESTLTIISSEETLYEFFRAVERRDLLPQLNRNLSRETRQVHETHLSCSLSEIGKPHFTCQKSQIFRVFSKTALSNRFGQVQMILMPNSSIWINLRFSSQDRPPHPLRRRSCNS